MPSRAIAIGLAAMEVLAGCAGGGQDQAASPRASVSGGEGGLRYVALGDSYTIGTSIEAVERWPNQLVERVPRLDLVANLGVNGYTSADLIDQELPQLDGLNPEFVTLQIGVNDVVQGVSDTQYAGNVSVIMDDLLARIAPEWILCVATPDYTVTPSGGDFGDPAEQSDAIVRVNAIMREACEQRGARFVPEIFEISQGTSEDRSLVADDGLHPSGRQYALWVEAIAPVVEELLAR